MIKTRMREPDRPENSADFAPVDERPTWGYYIPMSGVRYYVIRRRPARSAEMQAGSAAAVDSARRAETQEVGSGL